MITSTNTTMSFYKKNDKLERIILHFVFSDITQRSKKIINFVLL